MKFSAPVYVIGVGAAGVVGLLLASWVYSAAMVTEIVELPMEARITDVRNSIGFNTDDTVLTFGTMQPGGTGSRPVVLDNGHPYAVDVAYYASGNMSTWIYIKNGTTLLRAGEETMISVLSRSPADTLSGVYGGTFHVVFKRHIGIVS